MSPPLAIAVFISGNGSNLQAIIDAIQSGQLHAEVKVVVSNNPDAYGIERAKQAGIPTIVIPHQDFPQRAAYENALIQQLRSVEPALIVLAGFMRILSPVFIDEYNGKVINIHPSLLPKYPGLNTYERALEAHDSEHGVSIHFVTNDLDGGPLIAQVSYPITPNDTPASLQQKAHILEHKLYPIVINWIAQGQLNLEKHRVSLEGNILSSTGYIFSADEV